MEFNIKMPQEIRLTKKHIFALIAIALLIFGYEKMGSETLTLHAYYPSPVGIYTRLVSLNKAAFAREKGDVTIGANNAATRPDGRLGIGTSLPQAKLDVRGNTDIDGLFRARGTSSFDGNINAGGNISSGGYVKLGTPATCDASAVGAIRYLASTGIQYCENKIMEILEKILGNGARVKIMRLFLLNRGKGFTNKEWVLKIAEQLKFPLEKIHLGEYPPRYPYRPLASDQPYLVLDSSKAKRILGWQQTVLPEEGLKRTIDYWKRNLHKSEDLLKKIKGILDEYENSDGFSDKRI